MRRLVFAGWLILGLSSAAAAEDWETLDDAAITEALTGRSLVYEDGAVQSFRESGGTTYSAGGGQSEGRWRVREDRYCSTWPPSDALSCYLLERGLDSGRLRFVGSGGDMTVGAYVEQ